MAMQARAMTKVKKYALMGSVPDLPPPLAKNTMYGNILS